MNKEITNRKKSGVSPSWKSIGKGLFIASLWTGVLHLCNYLFMIAIIGPPIPHPLNNWSIGIFVVILTCVEYITVEECADYISSCPKDKWFYISMGTAIILVLVFINAYAEMFLCWGWGLEWPSKIGFVLLIVISLIIAGLIFMIVGTKKILKEN